ncbi:MAG TPA: D-alanyl-D-alanine carboxypeptidase, partial [Acidobacteriota bacterium]|nr:D-alanyl-D-alanine carboxypeptidase [Acidobacteriota bacterium]
MKKVAAILIVILIHSITVFAGVDTSALQQTLQSSHLPAGNLGILVERDDQEVFALNSDRTFVPASLTKILTGAAAYEILSADHEFKTILLTDAAPSRGALRGSLFLKGGGDPSFSSRKLSALIQQLKGRNIRTINGNIVIDNSRFDEPTLNGVEAVRNFIGSWDRAGYPLFLSLDPTPQLKALLAKNVRYESRIRTMTAPTKNRDYVIYRNMNQPDLWTGIQLQQLLQKQKIAVRGKVIKGTTPAGASVV